MFNLIGKEQVWHRKKFIQSPLAIQNKKTQLPSIESDNSIQFQFSEQHNFWSSEYKKIYENKQIKKKHDSHNTRKMELEFHKVHWEW